MSQRLLAGVIGDQSILINYYDSREAGVIAVGKDLRKEVEVEPIKVRGDMGLYTDYIKG